MNRATLATDLEPQLTLVFGERAQKVTDGLLELAGKWAAQLDANPRPLPDQTTSYLITYGDSIRREGEVPLQTLRRTLNEELGGAITDVHLLPTYPWTSDDGFAVVDHREIDPALGTWEDVEALAKDRKVMLDFVANHMSARSPWFQGWLAGDPRFEGYFIKRADGFDVSQVTRPRTSPLFHTFDGADGTVEAWTTFSADQVDVNAGEPRLFIDLTDVLLGYVARGARTIRLDAIGFLWKESGTTSIHLPQTHALIQVWRTIVDHLAPGTLLITETNVPHKENISYFGDGTNEAHMVYQFALPPLVLDAFVTGDATVLGRWAGSVGVVSPAATWFNFLASHDGIGMRPSEGLLSDDARMALAERAWAHGGRVSMASKPDGSERPYELNVSYLDALSEPGAPDAEYVARALAAHSILFSLVGVPAIYVHSLFGSTGDAAGMESSGIARRINRAKLDADALAAELSSDTRRRSIFAGLKQMLQVRAAQPGFAPFTPQEVSVVDGRAMVVRRAAGTPDEIVAVTNVSDVPVALPGVVGTDVLTGQTVTDPVLSAHEFVWVRV